ncbi:MAG: hypothetical protein ACOXZ5_06545 [Syntrophomonadaceae bacterium]
MAIILKVLCFTVWLVMMVSLIIANRRSSTRFRKIASLFEDDDELELHIFSTCLPVINGQAVSK